MNLSPHRQYKINLRKKIIPVGLLLSLQLSLANALVFNNPYPRTEAKASIYYTSFTEQPKTLDPAKSYSANEYQFLGQIYEPLLQYDYFLRPYTLSPLTVTQLPAVKRFDAQGKLMQPADPTTAAKTVYTLHITPGIYYQPHPAFAKDNQGQYEYHHLPKSYVSKQHIHALSDFKHTGTRELIAEDYSYQIKRLANPRVNSSIYGLMSEHIAGFKTFGQTLPEVGFTDLRQYPLSGVRVIDRYTLEITLSDEYPQFIFWLAMPFFSPIPWEADLFYAQPGMDARNINFSWYPVGTGPFMMVENNPNSRMVLKKNPFYRETYFPAGGSEADRQQGYLVNENQRLPLLDEVVFVLEKESIPRWNKFLQGYYDLSGISADSFDQVVAFSPSGAINLTPQMQAKGVCLEERIESSVFYLGFNWLDPIVGGNSERASKLRQAIAIAVNFEENISIFFNGRGESAQGPIPPGIFGYQEGEQGINHYVYRWENEQRKRRSLQEARQLLREAGYPDAINPVTKKPLILNYDVPSNGGPDEKAELNWMVKQFAAIGIQLNIRATQYNQFQEKMRNGNAQLFFWGWNADYPDPENFLFLLYGPNGKAKFGGENATNYSNAQYDALFEQMKNRPNDATRLTLINQMLEIIRHDAPWAGGINLKVPVIRQQWMTPTKPNSISINTLKYVSIDIPMRNQLRAQWNQVILWPMMLFVLAIIVFIVPFWVVYYRRQHLPANRMGF